MSVIVRAGDLQTLGGKANALAQLDATGLPIPEWFVVSPEAMRACMSGEWQSPGSSEKQAREVLRTLQLPDAIRKEISEALSDLGGERFAVRSSATEEDSAERSFAGQFDSFLFVSAAEVPDKVIAVWRSAFSDRVLAYRREHGLSALATSVPAVLVQRMINADASGVAFAADPISGERSVAVVSAVFGLGSALVSGEADADVYRVDRENCILSSETATKTIRHAFDAKAEEGVSAVALRVEQQNARVLSDEQACEIAAMARKASAHFGRPQDIEWAMENGQIYLLQSRPITTLGNLADPEGELNIWDNSNITESYSGVTTPLTFSFARYIYEGVYRQFCRVLGVQERKIAASERTFQNMLGLIRGRVYYNLLNWYRVLAMLPGFTVNRKFMEQMMGVREPMPESIVAQLSQSTFGERVRDAGSVLRMIWRLITNHLSLDRQIRAFYVRIDEALVRPTPPLSQLRADELAAQYRELDRKLLTHWEAPLINDFFAMIFHGGLRKLSQKWLADESGQICNDLVRGQSGMISAEPARRIREMSQIAAKQPELARSLREDSPSAMRKAMSVVPEFQSRFDEYLGRFGDRCLEELKLESITIRDEPLSLLRNIGAMASAANPPRTGVANDKPEQKEAEALAPLRSSPMRRIVFLFVLGHARKLIRNRENLRFQRTLLFGRVREIFCEIGRRFHADGLLDDPRDIFYLTVEEIFAYLDGHSVNSDLKALASLRKRDFETFRTEPAPPDRFTSHGVVSLENQQPTSRDPSDSEDEQRQGIGCCAGVVSGVVRVVRDPRNAVLEPGCILVAERTDPGWVMLFPAAAGLLVERGSLLSHSAIVAREMGIPAIVSIAGVTRWLNDGDRVEIDGARGVVRKLTHAESPVEAHV